MKRIGLALPVDREKAEIIRLCDELERDLQRDADEEESGPIGPERTRLRLRQAREIRRRIEQLPEMKISGSVLAWWLAYLLRYVQDNI